MNQQILFIGGPLDRRFDDVESPLPVTLSVTNDRGDAVRYALHYVVEERRQALEKQNRGDRRWPVYVHGPLPPTSDVLNLWYVRATFWQMLPSSTGTGLSGR